MRKKLNNKDFSVRFMFVMSGLGITTVGQAKKLLDKCNPSMKLGITRANFLQKELKFFLEANKPKMFKCVYCAHEQPSKNGLLYQECEMCGGV